MTRTVMDASPAGRLSSRAGAAFALWLASCSSASDASGPQTSTSASSESGAVIGCAGDPRAETYGADMSQVGSAKALTFILVAANPAPPAIDDNTWTVKVLDSSGSPLSNATLSIKTWMPDHGHGSPETPMATPNADATYDVQPLYLFMNGLWQITITAQAGAASDTATFSFCVGG